MSLSARNSCLLWGHGKKRDWVPEFSSESWWMRKSGSYHICELSHMVLEFRKRIFHCALWGMFAYRCPMILYERIYLESACGTIGSQRRKLKHWHSDTAGNTNFISQLGHGNEIKGGAWSFKPLQARGNHSLEPRKQSFKWMINRFEHWRTIK